ncbi:hypothetical protein BST81_17535 [Leptolyngbya sp. 'hensonii']|nr:hypothetical protein BST81_17535 [Leptolyngbya sp. 'hensonii']
MHVVNQTSTQLILRHFPLRAWVLSGSLLTTMIVLGLLLIQGGQRTTLDCRRSVPDQGNCRLLVGVPGRDPLADQTIPLTEIAEAEVQTFTTGAVAKGAEETYTVLLLTPTRKISFQSLQSSRAEAEAVVSRINQFLQNPSEQILTLTYRHNTFSWRLDSGFVVLLLLVGVPALVLLLILVSAESQILTYTFDKTQGQLTIKAKGIFGQRVEQFPLHEIGPALAEISYSGLPLILPNTPIATAGTIHINFDLKCQIALKSFFS